MGFAPFCCDSADLGPLDVDTPGRPFMPRHLGRGNNCLAQVKANGEKKTKICHLFAFPHMVTYSRGTAIVEYL